MRENGYLICRASFHRMSCALRDNGTTVVPCVTGVAIQSDAELCCVMLAKPVYILVCCCICGICCLCHKLYEAVLMHVCACAWCFLLSQRLIVSLCLPASYAYEMPNSVDLCALESSATAETVHL